MKAAEVKEAFEVLKGLIDNEEADMEAIVDAVVFLDMAIYAKAPVVVKVPEAEYLAMQKRLNWLDCLEAAGVDNWQGIEEAIRIKNEDVE